MSRNITVEHEGTTYSAQVAEIESTHLGPEGHGIPTAYLHFKGDGWGIGVGGYGLGSGYGFEHISALMNAVGAERWEDLPGMRALVLFKGASPLGGMAVGVAHISDESKVLILADHAQAWRDKHEDGVR